MSTNLKYFALDLRSLALMRIVVGLVICSDVLIRLFQSQPFLYGQDLAENSLILSHIKIPWIPSLHILSSELGYQILLLVLQFIFAIGLTLGWRVFWMTLSSWVLCLSLHFSNELILNGGDYLLRNLLFIGMFLPWGKRYSLDRPETPLPVVTSDAASVLLFGQVCILYWSAAMLKAESSWNQDFTALYYSLNLDIFATSFGLWLLKFPTLLKLLTGLSYGIEWVAPALLFWGKPSLRTVGICSLILLHISIGATLRVGLFWIVPIAALLGLWPSEYWQVSEAPSGNDGEGESTESNLSGLVQVLLGLLLLSLLYLNLLTNPSLEKRESMPTYTIMRTLGIHYGWGMFTKMKQQRDGWFQVHGVTPSGEILDLETGSQPNEIEPRLGSACFTNQRWRRYLLNLLDRRYEEHRSAYLKLVLKRFKATNPGINFREIRLVFMEQPTLPDYRDSQPQAVVLESIKLPGGL